MLDAAGEGARRCLSGKRWGGSAVLMLVDAALDSIVRYFNIVVPRVCAFYERFVRTGEIATFEHLAARSPDDDALLKIMRNRRVWNVAIEASRVFSALKARDRLRSDFDALAGRSARRLRDCAMMRSAG